MIDEVTFGQPIENHLTTGMSWDQKRRFRKAALQHGNERQVIDALYAVRGYAENVIPYLKAEAAERARMARACEERLQEDIETAERLRVAADRRILHTFYLNDMPLAERNEWLAEAERYADYGHIVGVFLSMHSPSPDKAMDYLQRDIIKPDDIHRREIGR